MHFISLMRTGIVYYIVLWLLLVDVTVVGTCLARVNGLCNYNYTFSSGKYVVGDYVIEVPTEMGSTLCKDRNSKSTNKKNIVDCPTGGCTQICPPNLTKKKHFWEKQVLETSPPTIQDQPKPTELTDVAWRAPEEGWRTVSLTVPENMKPEGPPVAPPRKKRPSMLYKDGRPMKNGFKDVFTGQLPDSNDTANNNSLSEPNLDETDSNSDRKPVTLTRKVSKVGNKKSDKFFGENLSDCLSDELVDSDDDDDKKEENTQKSENVNLESDNKDENHISLDDEELAKNIKDAKANMLFALSYHCNMEKEGDEPDRVPVEEKLIVPMKRKVRHICDNTEALHDCLHNKCIDPSAPKKPERDFTRYKKSLENVNFEENEKTNIEKDLSANLDKLNKPSERNSKTNSSENLSNQDSKTESLADDNISKNSPSQYLTLPTKLSRSVSSSPAKMARSEKALRKSLSSQSFLTPELIEKLAQQAHSLACSTSYLPEDYYCISASNDGSGLVSPNFKLDQKKCLSPQISTCDQDNILNNIKDNIEDTQKVNISRPLFEIGGRNSPGQKSERSDELPPYTQQEDIRKIINPDNIKKSIEPKKTLSTGVDILEAAKSFIESDNYNDEEVLKFFDEEFGELLLPEEDRIILEELRTSIKNKSKNSDLCVNSSKPTEVCKITTEESINGDSVEIQEIESKDDSVSDMRVVSKVLNNKLLDTVAVNDKRRHSIDELSSWFESDGIDDNLNRKQRKREQSLPNNLLSSPYQDTLLESDDSDATIKNEPQQNNEHSPLLKFLDVKESNYN